MESVHYRCPCCGAALTFGAESQQLDCPSCGNSFSLESIEQAAKIHVDNTTDEELRWDSPESAAFATDEHDHLRSYRCQSCGAEILTDESTAATACVYCGNPSLMPGALSGIYRPDGVIPFRKTKEDAQRAFRNHCKGRPLLPKGFSAESRVEKITGVYVPFWLFQCEAEADVTYNAQRVSVRREGDYEVTRTAHFLVRRGGHVGFKAVPVDGSSKMEDALMESIEPYDSDLAKDFTIAYLSGYQAQRYDVDAASCQPRANQRIRASVASLMSGTVMGYSSFQPLNTQIKLQHGKVRQVLMPVWLLNTRWRDHTYTFAMNGQTGNFIGDLPTSKGRFAAWLLGLFAGVSLGGAAIAYALFSMGVM